MMGDLYGIATSVIVFLGEESDDSDLAIDFAENLTRLLQNLPTDYHVTPARRFLLDGTSPSFEPPVVLQTVDHSRIRLRTGSDDGLW